jgi:hypothetical protein
MTDADDIILTILAPRVIEVEVPEEEEVPEEVAPEEEVASAEEKPGEAAPPAGGEER